MQKPLFEELYSTYYKEIFKYLKKKTKTKDVAEDLTQECFYKVFMQLEQQIAIVNCRAYIYSIARHTLADFYRNNHLKVVALDSLSSTLLVLPSEPGELMEAVRLLDYNSRQIVLLKYQGYSLKEIAVMLNVNHSTLRSQYSSVVKRLKMYLKS